MSEDYLALEDKSGSEEALKNIVIVQIDTLPKFDPF